MHREPLDFLPLWGLFLAHCLIGWLAVQGGFWFGRWRHCHEAGEKEAPVGALVAAILGLLAFILAFTFQMAASRFDARRQVVLEEANAIGTTYLRTRLLSEPQRSETARLLRDYVDVRIRAIESGDLATAVARSEQLQEQVWLQAVAAAEKNPNPVQTGLFIQSLNEMIDLHAKRILIGVRSRIPLVIWLGLFALAFIGMASIGYQAGLAETQRSPAMLAIVLAFAGVLALIADLDRGQEGFLTVNQEAMTDLQRSMQTTTSQNPR
jgi:hypothetical protein